MTIPPLFRRTGRLLKVAGAVATVLVVVTGGAAIALVGVGPRTGRYGTLTVLSGSMKPAIAPGSVVVVRPVHPARLRTGDVIAFQAPVDGRPTVTHRVMEIDRAGGAAVVRTKGDANSSLDPWKVELASGPAWRVWQVVPGVGRVINVLTRPQVRRVVTTGMPALFLVVWMVTVLPVRQRDDEAADGAAQVTTGGRPSRPALGPGATWRRPSGARPSFPATLAVGAACLAVGTLSAWAAEHDGGRR